MVVMKLLELPCIEVTGSTDELGEALGAGLQDEIAAMIDRRMKAAESYFTLHGCGSVEEMVFAGGECLAVLWEWDPDGHVEHVATAAAAGVEPATLYAAANYSDMRDLVCMAEPGDADEGCTSMAVPGCQSVDGQVIVGQTWDLHPLDVDSVWGVHRIPDEGPETWSVTVAGAPTLIGMNVHGIWTGTTNIKVAETSVGVGYMSLLHRAIRCRDREEAAGVIQHAPRAAAHTFLLADAGGAIELECTGSTTTRRDLSREPLVRTNHCAQPIDAEPPSSSSVRRLDRATTLVSAQILDIESVRRLMRDREDGIDSICRYEQDGEPTATNACVIGEPASRRLEACRGPADRGEWVQLSFA
jgi:hypothetical protein